MNPLAVEAIGSVLRAGLNVLAGILVTHGIWTQSDAEKYVGALVLVLLSLGWSLWQKYGMRSKLVTAMAMPAGVTENQVKAAVDHPDVVTPSVLLPKDRASVVSVEPPPRS